MEKKLTIGSLKPGVRKPSTQSKSIVITKNKFKELKRILEIEQKQNYFKFEIYPGQNILEAALESGVGLDYKCKKGTCGKCTLRIVNGQSYLTQPNQAEAKKLESLVQKGYRLACQASAQ
ncbi:2Fe-2S iron-sulfur cluster-binding protein [Bacillus marasmi]|uniref:2Fe-2S iron-sulfur cluster-binding protein n=1 Tax=Bacillus marasmi TaxID=1926279 RepID=UPI00164D2F67|nr:2Fe-2S iron-sulfur cluster binding domain-containing protein [Bacillus marasmi]